MKERKGSGCGKDKAVGIEDRDWYREKQIDWERGGLKDRNAKRPRFPRFRGWMFIVLLIVALLLFRYAIPLMIK